MARNCADCNKKFGFFEESIKLTGGKEICDSCLENRWKKRREEENLKKEVEKSKYNDKKGNNNKISAKELNKILDKMHGLEPPKEKLSWSEKRKQKKKRKKRIRTDVKKFDIYQNPGVDEVEFHNRKYKKNKKWWEKKD